MGHSDHEVGPRIDLECASCGEIRLDAAGMICPHCWEKQTVCFECIPKDDERRIDSEMGRLCSWCQDKFEGER
jgi:hypothetical protein